MKSFRRFLRVLVPLLVTSFGVAICEAQTPPTRIMPLGDSLTSGTTVQGAYRNRLYNLLTTAGYNVDFVGTQTDSNNPTLPDRDHQGMGGYRIDQIQAGLPSWLSAIEDPDVVLLMIGTNDFSANFNTGSAPARLTALIDDIATKRPFAKIILANLLLRTDNPNLEALQSAFNATIPGIVSNQVSLGRQVSFVDMHAALLPGDFSEGVHPTSGGYDKMAAAWLPAITSVITPLGTANPPAIVRTEPATDSQHITVRFSKPLADSAGTLANFSLNGGLTISQAVLDPVTKRTITLTTSSQTPGALYTLTVSGVRDRTPQQNLIAAGSKVNYSALTLLNGSFEAGETGWTMTGNRLNYASDGSYVATNGTKMMILNGGNSPPNAILSQTFATIPGQYYMLNFDVGVLALNTVTQQLGVSVIGATTLVAQIQTPVGNALGVSVWSAKSYPFIADSTTTTLNFQDQSASTSGIDLLLDNVRITATVNTSPVAVADSYSTIQGVALVVPAAGVLANDSDAESNPLTAILNVGPTHGSVTLNADGSFTYTPTAGYTGPDSFTYHARDGNSDSNIATVSIAVNAPAIGTLVNGSFESGENGWSMTGNRLVYQSDGTYVATDPAPTGSAHLLVLNGGPAVPNAVIKQVFATAPGQAYTLAFDIGVIAINTSEQKLQVSLVNANSSMTQEEIDFRILHAGTTPDSLLLANASVFGNSQGTSAWTPKSYSFVAVSNLTSLAFTDLSPVTNGIDLLLDNVRVSTAGPSNTAPVAVADSYSTNQGVALVVPASGVLANDTDAQSNPLTAALNAGPGHGTLTLNPNGGFTYTPAAGYTGADSFTYHANDGLLDSNVVTVSLTVNLVNTAPVAVADSYSTNQGTTLVVAAAGVLANDTDAQSNPLTAVLNAGPGHGSVTLNGNGGFTYTPAAGYSGTDSFTYHANDGLLDSNVATVSLVVNAPNAPQLLVNGSFESDFTGWTITGNRAIETYDPTDGAKLVSFNSHDLEANAILSQTFPTVAGQTYTLTFDQGVLSYLVKQQKLAVTVTGTKTLLSQTITITGEGQGDIQWESKSYTFVANSATSTLTFRDRSSFTSGIDLLLDNVRVSGSSATPNTAPVAVADSYSLNKNTALVVAAPGVLSNDTDPQSNSITAVLETGPTHGTLALSAGGGFTYTPATGYTGADSFTYHANDGSLNSATAAVSLTVNPPPAGLLVNPSFESDFTGWTMTGNQSIEYYQATDGVKIVAFNSQNRTPNATLAQTFATTAGKTYSLTFDAGFLAYTTDSQTVKVTVSGAGSLLSQTVTLNGLGGGLIRWFPQSFTFTADSATTTLTFRDQSTATVGIDLLLDNVRVFAAPTASIASLPAQSAPVFGATGSLTSMPGYFAISTASVGPGVYVLERSEDLKTWEYVEETDPHEQPVVEFYADSPARDPLKKQMFYRIKLPLQFD